jgi:hypothetical protein
MQRQAGYLPPINRQVNRILARVPELDALKGDDHVQACRAIFSPDLHINIATEWGNDELGVLVDEVECHLVRAFFDALKSDPGHNSARWVHNWEGVGPQHIKCPKQIEFALGIRGGVSEQECFNIHAGLPYPMAPIYILCYFRSKRGLLQRELSRSMTARLATFP